MTTETAVSAAADSRGNQQQNRQQQQQQTFPQFLSYFFFFFFCVCLCRVKVAEACSDEQWTALSFSFRLLCTATKVRTETVQNWTEWALEEKKEKHCDWRLHSVSQSVSQPVCLLLIRAGSMPLINLQVNFVANRHRRQTDSKTDQATRDGAFSRKEWLKTLPANWLPKWPQLAAPLSVNLIWNLKF